jgi:hypothetical protein
MSNRSRVAVAALVISVVVVVCGTVPPAGAQSDLNCEDFTHQEDAQAVLVADRRDPHGLDEDRDGIACNHLPSRRVAIVSTAVRTGVWTAGANGRVDAYGVAAWRGDYLRPLPAPPKLPVPRRLNAPIVGMARTFTDAGYWLLGRDGGIFSYGDATFHGSTGGMQLNQPVVGISVGRDSSGYWLVAADGGVFAFDVPFYGSAGALPLNQPVVGMATSPTGNGYWLVARDGGIFAYGDAVFAGSTGDIVLNQPIVGMAADPDGAGYWFVAADGGVFAFDAGFHGSAVGLLAANDRVVGMAPHAVGGYILATESGRIIGFGAGAHINDCIPDPWPCQRP